MIAPAASGAGGCSGAAAGALGTVAGVGGLVAGAGGGAVAGTLAGAGMPVTRTLVAGALTGTDVVAGTAEAVKGPTGRADDGFPSWASSKSLGPGAR